MYIEVSIHCFDHELMLYLCKIHTNDNNHFLQAHLNKIEIATNYPFLIESKADLKDSYFNDLEIIIPTCLTSV